MQKLGFTDALEHITNADPRYPRDAYAFLRDALDFTIKQKKKAKDGVARHVSGADLLDGARLYALKEFGPMTLTVLNFWGIRSTLDFGHMVFNLIEAGVFGKTEQDSIEDFRDGYDFDEAFAKPYLPGKPAKPSVPRPSVKSPSAA